ncbi:hypothetical protein BGX28_005669 [Mortierella sp. GBA30]|nr:hypothetical protein BGX28_005669 [Mortierella sp. GBA30]
MPHESGSITTDAMKSGDDFIPFDFGDSEDDSTSDKESASDPSESQSGNKRKRSPSRDSKVERRIDSPPDCPWMDNRIYTDMNSVPLMLTQELKDFVHYISPSDEEHQIRQYVFKRLQQSVRSLWPDAETVVFGSFDTKLYLPSSDMDIVVLRDQDITKDDLYLLADYLRKGGIAVDISVIAGARVPLVKFKETNSRIPVDVSFNISNGIKSAEVIKRHLEDHPGLRPLTMIMKHFLMLKNHNEVFTGGLGSYTTTLMILSFLQMHPQIQAKMLNEVESLGTLLIEFFELYGKCFNYKQVGISLSDGGCYFDKNLYQPNNNRGRANGGGPMLMCIDPNDPTNDTSRGSYQLRSIRKEFVEAFNKLTHNVRQRDKELFGDQGHHRNARRHGKHRKHAKNIKQISLINNVLTIPKHIIKHRRHVHKEFQKGTFQQMLNDSEVDPAEEQSKPTELQTQQQEARVSRRPGDKVVAPGMAPLRDVEFIHAADSDEDEDEDGAYFDDLMKKAAEEYGDDDDDDDDGGAEEPGAHQNPGNVVSSEDSIMLPQLQMVAPERHQK